MNKAVIRLLICVGLPALLVVYYLATGALVAK